MEFTNDAILNGRVILCQPRSGYRFSIDSLLLADFVRVKPNRALIDLGAGCGVISMALALRMEQGLVIAVEIQHRLAECIRGNIGLNESLREKMAEIRVMESDWNDLIPSDIGTVDGIVANPPYYRLGSGRLNPDGEEAIARHEIKGSLASAAEIASRLLQTGGLFSVIYPAERLPGLITDLAGFGFEPKRLRMIHSAAGEPARLVMLESKKGAGPELTVEPPLFVYKKEKVYMPEVEAILSGEKWGVNNPAAIEPCQDD